MNKDSNEDIIREIESIERQLRDLRLTLKAREERATTGSRGTDDKERLVRTNHESQVRAKRELRVGDIARILNPNTGQAPVGKVTKISHETDRVTIQVGRFRKKIVRAIKNVERITDPSL